VERFVGSRAGWITRTLAKLRRDLPDPRTAILTIFDRPYSIVVHAAGESGEGVTMEDDRLVVRAGRPDIAHIRLLLRSWLRALGGRDLPPVVAATAARLGFSYRRIQVRDQRTRWGSCSRLGTLSFNWRLVLVPGAVRRYLIVHELCHLRHMNHSVQFWSEVERHEPEWPAAEQWLRRHGRTVAW
jgi:predicted metal-dependent hydrolase